MDVRQMRYLVAVADELNFSRAAARCGVSQPPLSRAIAQLEAEVGSQLFNRDSHRVTITSAGQSLVDDARRAIALIEASLRRAQRIGGGLHGTLSIGFGGTPVYRLWPSLIERFRSTVPDVQINFVAMPVLKQIEALRERKIDLGIVRLPVHDEMLQTAAVYREPLILAAPKSFGRLAGADHRVKMTDLAGERFVTYAPQRGFDYNSDFRSLCRLADFEPKIVHEGETTEAIVGMVACGEGIAILPADARRLEMRGVVFRELNLDEAPERLATVEFALAWVADHHSAAVKEFINCAKTHHYEN